MREMTQPNPQLSHQFVQACHILADQGHAVGVAGQVTCRQSERHWLTLPLGTGFEEASSDNILVIDDALEVLWGDQKPNPGVKFHQWIYRRNPQVQAIVHTHSAGLSALSMLGTPMPVAHMDAAMFFEDCGFLADWPGVPTGDEEGALISAALLGKRSAFLANHGIVCTGNTLSEAIYLKVFAERNARMCLDAMAVGELAQIAPRAAQEAHDFLLQPFIVDATFAYWARQAERNR
jgi:L-fuculose-phosphate aldolase